MSLETTDITGVIKPGSFSFNKAAAGNGGTVMGPFLTDGNLNVKKYVIVIEGKISEEGGGVKFNPTSNSIVLFKDEDTVFASKDTSGNWDSNENSFVEAISTELTGRIAQIKPVVPVTPSYGGRKQPTRKASKSNSKRRRRRHRNH